MDYIWIVVIVVIILVIVPMAVKIVAEYERAAIRERSRRGKLHAARRGSIIVLSNAPYGYRYVSKSEGGGEACYDVILPEAQVVVQMFKWIGEEPWCLNTRPRPNCLPADKLSTARQRLLQPVACPDGHQAHGTGLSAGRCRRPGPM